MGVAAYAVLVWTEPLGAHNTQLALRTGQVGCSLAAATGAWVAADRSVGASSRAWRLMSVAALCWAAAQTGWSINDLAGDVPATTAARLAFLPAPMLIAFALWSIQSSHATPDLPRRALIDGVVVATLMAIIAWPLFREALSPGPGTSVLGAFAGFAHPLADIAIVTMVILLWSRGGAGHPPHVRLLNSGLLLIAGADASSFALEGTDRRLVPGLTSVGWLLGFTLVALAAAAAVRGRLASTNDAPSPNLLPVATMALATAAAGVAVVTSLTAESEWTALTVAMGALTIVLVGRQALIDHEGGALRRRLDHELLHDPLTGLPNRVLARDRIEQALKRSRRNNKTVGVMLLDLDGLGRVTDSLGRDTGDRFLIAVASRLRRELRSADTIARLGNNEFGLVVASGPRHGVLTVARRILESLGNAFDIGGVTTSTKTSIGVVLAHADDGAAAETLLHRAQVAMHAAKGSNCSSISIFTTEMEDAAVQRMQLEDELRQALDEGKLTLAFQPIVSLATEEVVGVEALARWSTPDRGSVPPSVFIPVAEDAGLIGRLGRWVISEGLSHISGWRDVTNSTVTLGVNVSSLQLNDDRFADDVEQALRLAGVSGERLVVEVTESVAMGDVAASVEQLARLKTLGVRVALDDFGTGHSSLAHLRTLPVDILKIDRCFVAGVAINPADRATVKAICTLATDSGLAVVAEGVETASQAATLHELGCGLAQGYYFGRPVPPAEILTYQTNRRFLAGFRLHSVPDPSLGVATFDREALSG